MAYSPSAALSEVHAISPPHPCVEPFSEGDFLIWVDAAWNGSYNAGIGIYITRYPSSDVCWIFIFLDHCENAL